MKKLYTLIVLIIISNTIIAQCWKSVSPGLTCSGGIKTNGTLWMWGWNNSGQLGTGTNSPSTTATQIGFENNWKKVAVGENSVIADGTGGRHSIAIKTEGSIWSWGLNTYGQLGQNSTTSLNSPSQIGSDTNWKDVSVGPHHTIALKTNGTLWAWGNNQYGQLGINSITDTIIPTQVGTDSDWDKIATGSQHCLAIKTNGTLWSWGRNNYYQLGFFNDNSNKLVPTQVGSDSDWLTITVGGDYSFAIKNNNTLWGWGRNDESRLGLGTTSGYHPIPEQIGTGSNWINVDAGNSHTYAMKIDSTSWGWGFNFDGQLAQGNNTWTISAPVQISLLSNTSSIYNGGYSGMSLNNNGELYVWGNNGNHNLGTGVNSNYNTPQIINCPPPFVLPIHTSGTSTIYSLVHEGSSQNSIDLILINGDTTAKTMSYNNVYYKNQDSSQFMLVGHIRQDTNNTQAWYKSVADTTEYLIMDLNLAIGDTFVVKYFSNPTTANVINVDTINGRKRILLDYSFGNGLVTENLTFIEGIGPNASLFFQSDDMINPINHQYSFLTCNKKVNGNMVFSYYQDTSECYSNTTVNINTETSNNIALNIYPNPTSGLLYIDQLDNIKKIKLIDITGKTIYENSKNLEKINLTSFNTGIYILKVETHNRSFYQKIIKQ
tara:strand:- start:4508 stop:6481 length:1974 start_codon:yes stop_codon:yes gene_type:complete